MASAASSSGPAASVTVEDESTKTCSACLQDRPASAYSSAQLKKKGKRVCQGCVAHKAGAASAQKEAADKAASAARKDAMKDAFATKLNTAPPQAASECLCCTSKAAVRSAPCIRCSVPCCSLKCFDRHDCDAYLEPGRTMPAGRISKEDRLSSQDELHSLWSAFCSHVRALPIPISADAVDKCSSGVAYLSRMGRMMQKWNWTTIRQVYLPCVAAPWWSPDGCKRLHTQTIEEFLRVIVTSVALISVSARNIMDHCVPPPPESQMIRKLSLPRATANLTSACLLPGRLLHKLLTLLIFIVRALPTGWLKAEFGVQPQVDSDLFGLLPPFSPCGKGLQLWLGYVQHEDPQTGERTLVPLVGSPIVGSKCHLLRQHLGCKELMMFVQEDGTLVLDRGLYVDKYKEAIVLSAVTGWTGRPSDSFTAAPMETLFLSNGWLQGRLDDHPDDVISAEIAARKRPDFFHIIHAIRSMIPKDEWPTEPNQVLFLATPQLGIESELVELSLLESLVAEAAAGDAHAQLLLAHIEAECAAPIADVITRQKSRLDQMLEDQAAQLRIHAEAVARAELRGRIKAAAAEGSSEGAAASSIGASSSSSSSASALASSSAASSSSAVAPSSAASAAAPSVGSSTALSSVSSASAACGESAVPYSWTASKAYASLADVCTAGRAKYKTITSAALRFLHTLRPVSVNRSGGSHTVFHFASGKPVTLVKPHGGDGTVSRHAATRLYAVLHEAALQQLSPAEALPATSSRRRAALTDASL